MRNGPVLAMLAALATAHPAWAQSGGQPGTQPGDAPARVETPVSGAAQPVVGAPAGPKVDATVVDDWRVECYDPPVNGLKCQMLQQLVEREQNKVVLITSLAYLPSSQATQIQIVLPLGFLLKRGVELEAGGYTSTVAPDRCTAQGCIVEGVAAPELIAAFRRAKDARVSIVADNGQTVRVPFSLMGFTKAYDMVEQRNREAVAANEAGAAGGESSAQR